MPSKKPRFTLASIQRSTATIAVLPKVSATQRILIAAARERTGPTPHQILWLEVHARWGGRAVMELRDAVPGRNFRIDIAFPMERLAIEVDGWQFHGRRLGDFTRDRERQNLLCVHGWRILRFTAGMIRKDLGPQIDLISRALEATPSSVGALFA